MNIDIPTQNPWKQLNDGDLQGSIWKSRNIDLKDKKGYVKPSEKLIVTTLDGTEVSASATADLNLTLGSSTTAVMRGAFVEAPDGATEFPTYVNSWSASSVSGVTSLTKEITVPSGTNRALIALVLGWRTDSVANDQPTGVTFNTSEAFSAGNSGGYSSGTDRVQYSWWYLPAPTETTADVAVTWADTDQANSTLIIFALTGAKQTSTFGTGHNVNTAPGTTLGYTADGDTLTGVDYEMLISVAMCPNVSHTYDRGTVAINTTVGSYRYSAVYDNGLGYLTPQDLPVAFAKARGTVGGVNDIRWFVAAGTGIYSTATEDGEFNLDDATGTPTTGGKAEVDIKAFDGQLHVVDNTKVYNRDTSNTYTTNGTAPPGDNVILENFGARMYIASGPKVYSMNTSNVVATSSSYTLNIGTAYGSLDDETEISCMRAVSNGLWIGTVNKIGGRARMIFWDGITADTPETIVLVDSGMVMAMSVLNDVPYILDNQLRLSAWNGSYFEEVARLDNENKLYYNFKLSTANNRFIHHNGMQTINGEILMALNLRPDDTVSDTYPIRHDSGIYAYNPEYGIYHKYSFTSQQDAATGLDQGQLQVSEVGAIYPLIDDEDNEDVDDMSDFLVGFSYFSDNSTTRYAIAKHDKRGLDMNASNRQEAAVIVTTRIRAEQVKETFEKLYTFVRPFKNSTDKLVLSYRKQEYTPTEASITWVNTTSFTTTTDISAIQTNVDAGVDYEVEVLLGDGAGYIAHVSSITEAGGTYTVTLDETITGMTTNTATVRFDRWTKIGSFTDDSEIEQYKEFTPAAFGATCPWAQFKLYMLGSDMQLERVFIKSSVTQQV